MKIYPLQTGSVKVKQAQKQREFGGMTRVILDSDWSDWLPIYSWLIKHPEGNILVDTGETSRTSKEGYFPSWHPYYRFAVKMDVSRDQEIDRQLANFDLAPSDIDTIILTHFHTDHAGGLYHFPESNILVPKQDYRDAKGVLGQLRGYLPQHWQHWFEPTEIEFRNKSYGPFQQFSSITKDGSVRIVPTPGHTAGHVSVVADNGSEKIFLAGDASYTQGLLLAGEPDGVSPDREQSIETLQRITRFAEEERVIYLPSHDPKSATRLKNKEALNIAVDIF